jgi:hypothetical protein
VDGVAERPWTRWPLWSAVDTVAAVYVVDAVDAVEEMVEKDRGECGGQERSRWMQWSRRIGKISPLRKGTTIKENFRFYFVMHH